MRQVYPTFIIDTGENNEHPFLVCVPDLDILTEGDDFADAIQMARDAIGLTGISLEDSMQKISLPSTAEQAFELVEKNKDNIDFTKGILTYVDVDFKEYRKKFDMRTVRRNVTLPSWLNYEAEHAGINVSRVLQEALINILGVAKKND